jgi:hypothetical protein
MRNTDTLSQMTKAEFKQAYSAYRKELTNCYNYKNMNAFRKAYGSNSIFAAIGESPMPVSVKVWLYYDNKGNKEMCAKSR